MRCTIALLCSARCLRLPRHYARRHSSEDLVSIEGVRDNQLVGYGIVVGLERNRRQAQTIFSTQSLANMLEKWASP